jgi:hypothetical protein
LLTGKEIQQTLRRVIAETHLEYPVRLVGFGRTAGKESLFVREERGFKPIVRILERIGRQIRALGVPDEQQWASVGALMAYILGVSRQNAANGQLAQTRGLDRADFLEAVSTAWSQLDPKEYPFARSVARQIRDHDDRQESISSCVVSRT